LNVEWAIEAQKGVASLLLWSASDWVFRAAIASRLQGGRARTEMGSDEQGISLEPYLQTFEPSNLPTFNLLTFPPSNLLVSRHAPAIGRAGKNVP